MQYCLFLSRKLKKTLGQLFDELMPGELEIQMAYDKFLSPEFQKKVEDDQRQLEFDNLSDEEKRQFLEKTLRRAGVK